MSTLSRHDIARGPILGSLKATRDGLTDALADLLLQPFASIRERGRTVVLIEADGLIIRQVSRNGIVVPRGRIDAGTGAAAELRSGPLEARLAPEHFLRRTITVPAAGRPYLDAIISHQLERLTPWRPETVLYGFAAAPQADASSFTVDLLLTAAPRIAESLARLEAAGLQPTALASTADPITSTLRIALGHPGSGSATRRQRRRIGTVALATLGFLGLAAFGSAWMADDAEADLRALDLRRATLQSRIRGGQDGSSEAGLIETHRGASEAGLLLDRLSAALPDHTVLRELDLTAEQVRLIGHSANAPALIAPLESEAGLTDLRFAAPIIRDAQNRDLFELLGRRAFRPAGPGP